MSELVRVREGANTIKGNLPAFDVNGFLSDSGVSVNDLKQDTPEVLETKIVKGAIVFRDSDSPTTLIVDSTEQEGSIWLINGELNQAPRTYLTLPDNDETLNRRTVVVLTTGNQILLLSGELSLNPLRPTLSAHQILIAEILQTPEAIKIGDISDLHKQDTDRALGKGTPEEITIEELNELRDRKPYTDEQAVLAMGDALQDSPSISLVMGEDGLRAFVIDAKYVPGGPAQFPDIATRDAFYIQNPHLRVPGLDVTIINPGLVPIAASVNIEAVKSVLYNNDIWVVGKNGDVVRWDVVNKKVLTLLSLGKSSIHAIVFGTRLFVAHPEDNQVSVINLSTRTLSTTLSIANRPCYFLEYSGLIYVLPEKELTMKVINSTSLAITTYTYAGEDLYGLEGEYTYATFQTMLRVGNVLYFPSISSDIYAPQSSMYWFDTGSKTFGCLSDTGQIAITHQALSANQRYIFLSAFTFNNDQGGLNVFDTQTKNMVYDEQGVYVYLRGFKHRMYVSGNSLYVSESINHTNYQIRVYDASTFSLAIVKTFTTGSAIASFNEANGKLYCTATNYTCYVIDLTTLEMTEFRLSRPLRAMQAAFGGFRVYDNWTMDTYFNLYSNGSQGAMIIDTVLGRNGIREKYFSDVENQRWVQTYPAIQFFSASETQKGLVQLTSSLQNTSNSLALTASAGKSLQDQVNATKPITVDCVITTNVDMNEEFPSEIDGVVMSEGKRVLFAGQTNKVQMGAYQYFAGDTFYYLRAADFDAGKSVKRGQQFLVLKGGSENGGAIYTITNAGSANIIVGVSAIELTRVGTSSESGDSLALGETSDTAYRGDQGKQAYDHSQETGNAHNLTKADLNLDQVANLAPANYPVSTAQAAADQAVKDELRAGVVTAGDNMAKLYALYQTLVSIIGGTTPDGNALVDQVSELLAVFSTYPEGLDIVTALGAKVNKTDLVNALTEVVAGKPLDATQGKILKDLLDGKAKDSLVLRDVGPVIDHTFDANSATSFTKVGSDTVVNYTASGAELTGVGANNTLNRFEHGWNTGAECFIEDLYFVPVADGSGIGVGQIHSAGGDGMLALVVLTGATKGQLRLEKINNMTGATSNKANSGATYFSITNGQQHRLTLVRYRASYSVIITNTVTNVFQLLNYNGIFNSSVVSNNDAYRAAKITVFHYGGSVTLKRLVYNVKLKVGLDLLVITDSLGAGIFSGTQEQSWVAKLKNACPTNTIDRIGMPSARVQDGVDILPEILAARPNAVLICLAYNDSVTATMQANIQLMLDACLVNGIKVFFATALPKYNVPGGSTNNGYIRSAAVTTKATVIDLDPYTLDASGAIEKLLTSDRIHFNSLGQDAIYRGTIANPSLSSYLLLSNKVDARLSVGAYDFLIPHSVWIASAYYAMGHASQAGTTVTGSGTNTAWTSDMVGSYIVYADGKLDLITAFTNGKSLTVATSRTVPTQSYVICKPGFVVNSSGFVGLGTLSPAEQLHIDGNVQLSAGNKLKVKAGSSMNLATLVAGTVTVNTTAVAANSVILVHRQTDGGTVAASYSVSKVAGTSITITAKDGAGANQTADTSTVVWRIVDVN